MGSSTRACAAALLLLASACSAQLSGGNYYTPNKYAPAYKCEDKVFTKTRLQETTRVVTRVSYKTVTVTSTFRKEQTQVRPTAVTRTATVTATHPVYVTDTSTITRVIYSTSTRVVEGGVKTAVRTEYIPVTSTLYRTSIVSRPNYVTSDYVTYITSYSTTYVGTPPPTPTIYVTSTVTAPGPVTYLTSTQYVPKYTTVTVPSPPVVETAYKTKVVYVTKVRTSYYPDVTRTSTVTVPQPHYVTKFSYETSTRQRVVYSTSTVRNTRTNYITSTVVQPVNVVKTVTLTNTITQTSSVYVTRPVTITNTNVVYNTQYGPEVLKTAYNPVTKVVHQPGPTVYVTSVSTAVKVNNKQVTKTQVVQRYVDRTVQVKQPCYDNGYGYQSNPYNF